MCRIEKGGYSKNEGIWRAITGDREGDGAAATGWHWVKFTIVGDIEMHGFSVEGTTTLC